MGASARQKRALPAGAEAGEDHAAYRAGEHRTHNSQVPDTDFYTDSTDQRRILNLGARGIPDIPVVGHYRYVSSMPPLPPESHVGMLEVCIMVKGEQRYRLGEESILLRGNHLMLVPPGVPFSTGDEPESKGELYWFFLCLPPEGGPEGVDGCLLAFTAEESRRIRELLQTGVAMMRPTSDRLVALAERTFKASAVPEAELGTAALRIALMDLVLELCEVIRVTGRARPLSEEIARAVERLQQFPDEPVDLPQLARTANLSVSRFKERFRDEVGFTPMVYATHLRITLAKEELRRDNLSITQIAYRSGFSSSQYFSHVFRKFAGVTPSEYRRRSRN